MYVEPNRTSKMEFFCKNSERLKFILDTGLDSKYLSASCPQYQRKTEFVKYFVEGAFRTLQLTLLATNSLSDVSLQKIP